MLLPQSQPVPPASPNDAGRPVARLPWLKGETLRQLQALHVGYPVTLNVQHGSRGANVRVSPGVRLPVRLTGYRDIFSSRTAFDAVLDASRRVSYRDTVSANLDAATGGVALTGSATWTRSLSRPLDVFANWQSYDPTQRPPYRALQFGVDVWPLRRLPARFEFGVRMLPAQPRLYFSIGYAPRRYRPSDARETAR